MAQRYNPAVGAMLSRPGGDFNVIADSLMKSQFLWWAADNGGPARLRRSPAQHAFTIARDFVRPDADTYHMVKYDATNGDVLWKGQSAVLLHGVHLGARSGVGDPGFSAAYRETEREGLPRRGSRGVCDWYLGPRTRGHGPLLGLPGSRHPAGAARLLGRRHRILGPARPGAVDPDGERRARYEAAGRAILTSLASRAYSLVRRHPGRASSRHVFVARREYRSRTRLWGRVLRRRACCACGVSPPTRPRSRSSRRGPPRASPQTRSTAIWDRARASRGRKSLDVRIAGTRRGRAPSGSHCVAATRQPRYCASWVSMDGRHWRTSPGRR